MEESDHNQLKERKDNQLEEGGAFFEKTKTTPQLELREDSQ